MTGRAEKAGGPPAPTPATPDPADGPVRLVDDRAGLDDLAARLGEAAEVALDVEANSLHAYHETVCVVQVTANGESWIVDPLALGDLTPLRDALDRVEVRVLLHGGDYDIATLSRDHDFAFHRVFDTMIAATILGEEKVGLANLVLDAYGVELDKRFQTADWGRRPLTEDQLGYLHRDTAYLPGLRARLEARLEAEDLVEEAEIEFAYLASRRGAPLEFDPDGWRRIKGAGRLDARGRAVARELWAWRDGEAARRDVPPFKVLVPRKLLALAEHPPRGTRQPKDLGMLHPRERRRYGHDILEAVRAGVARAREEDAPPKDARPRPGREEAARRRVERKVEEAIKVWRREEARVRGVPNLVVLPNRAVAWIVRSAPTRVEDLSACPDIGPKRIARYGEALVEVANRARS